MMASRKTPKIASPIRESDRKLVYMGDARQGPIEVRDGRRAYRPVVALWVNADDGRIVGQNVEEPGNPAQTLVRALQAAPGEARSRELPNRVILFDEVLAKQVKALLAPLDIEVMISAKFPPFEDLFTDLFAGLRKAPGATSLLSAPDDVLRALLPMAERLWRAKPWEYVYDDPPFGLAPSQDSARPFFVSILGHSKEVFGVVLCQSLEDHEAIIALGESANWPPRETASWQEVDAVTDQILGAMRHRVLEVTFEPKGEATVACRAQLARCGWPGRLNVVPAFAAMSGGQAGPLTVGEAADVAIAVDALIIFCQRHRKLLAAEAFPIRDTVEVSRAGKTVSVQVSVPGQDPKAPPAKVYRLKVSLTYDRDVWRRIDIRSDQTLEDLHYAIQEAFDWDDDHLYAFFMSGKAWDRSNAYVRPEGLQPGDHSASIPLRRLALAPRKQFLYIFDFGDELRHNILVEKAGLPPDEGEYPRIVETHGEAPPQYDWEEEDESGEEE